MTPSPDAQDGSVRPSSGAEDGVARFTAGSELTIYQALELHETLAGLLAGSPVLEVDLSSVHEIDAAGLQVLIRLKASAARDDRTLRMVGHSREVLDVLDLFQLESYFGDPLILPAADKAETRGGTA